MSFKPVNYLPYDFANRRHIGPSKSEINDMLKVIGCESINKLIKETVPEDILQKETLNWGKPKSEREALYHLRVTAAKNKVLTSLIGQGYHGTVTPPAIQRNILENPAWYTAYTPYQPEIAQGRLEALLNFQTMISDLTGLPVANASLLDESTAAAEAMIMAKRVSKSNSNKFFVDKFTHPQNIAVMKTRAEPLHIDIVIGHPDEILDDNQYFGYMKKWRQTKRKELRKNKVDYAPISLDYFLKLEFSRGGGGKEIITQGKDLITVGDFFTSFTRFSYEIGNLRFSFFFNS